MGTDQTVIIAMQAGMLTGEVFILGLYLQRRLAEEMEAQGRHFQMNDFLADNQFHRADQAYKNLKIFADEVGFPRAHGVSLFLRRVIFFVPLIVLGYMYVSLWRDVACPPGPGGPWLLGLHLTVVGTASTLMAAVSALIAIISGVTLNLANDRIDRHANDAKAELEQLPLSTPRQEDP